MKHILLPTDFSDTANNAFLYALQLANQLDVKLFVLYSYVPPILSSTHGGQPELLNSVYQEVELSKFDFFKKKVPLLHELAEQHQLDDSKLIFLFEQGTVVSSVKKVLAEEDIRLVVMGTHGVSGIHKQYVGTNTVAVIRNIQQPVLAIPEHATYSPIRHIAFTTLFREKDASALAEIIEISKSLHAKLTCVNVMSDAADPSDALLHADIWGKRFQDEHLEFLFLEKKNSVEETVNKFIAENGIDLLAVVKRNRNFFDRLVSSSLSNKLAFHSETPILVFHEDK